MRMAPLFYDMISIFRMTGITIAIYFKLMSGNFKTGSVRTKHFTQITQKACAQGKTFMAFQAYGIMTVSAYAKFIYSGFLGNQNGFGQNSCGFKSKKTAVYGGKSIWWLFLSFIQQLKYFGCG